jgi:hypothetical protein
VEIGLFNARMPFFRCFQGLMGEVDAVPVFPGASVNCKDRCAHVIPSALKGFIFWSVRAIPKNK